MATVTPTCSAADHARLCPQRSCSKKISVLAMGLKRPGHDADIGNPRRFHRVHHCGEGAEGHIFIRPQENRLMLWIAHLLPQFTSNFVDVDRIVSQKHSLLFVNADHQPLFGDLFHGSCFGNADFDSGLQHRRGDHENDQQHQHHIYQRSDVDVGKRELRASVGSRESHYRRTSSGARGTGAWRSTALSISSEKSSQRAAKSRIEPPIRLYAITAGIAAARPAAVVIKASEIPGATARRLAPVLVPSPRKASMIPQTVPNRPMNGVTAPVIASQGMFRSKRVISSEDAICMAR